jgi:hypothetical protein
MLHESVPTHQYNEYKFSLNVCDPLHIVSFVYFWENVHNSRWIAEAYKYGILSDFKDVIKFILFHGAHLGSSFYSSNRTWCFEVCYKVCKLSWTFYLLPDLFLSGNIFICHFRNSIFFTFCQLVAFI